MPTRPPKHRLGRAGGVSHNPEKERRAEYEATRKTRHERGYDSKWVKARKAYLNKHPLCCQCKSEGVVCAATVVDHIIPHRGDKQLFWDSENWQPLCKQHHDRKTASEGRWEIKK